jgi:hypothetical protein
MFTSDHRVDTVGETVGQTSVAVPRSLEVCSLVCVLLTFQGVCGFAGLIVVPRPQAE